MQRWILLRIRKSKVLFGLFFLFCLIFTGSNKTQSAPPQPIKVLLLYHPAIQSQIGDFSRSSENLSFLANVLGHFQPQITRVPIEKYYGGLMANYDLVFYLGDVLNVKIPDAFLEDIPKYQTVRVAWIKWNMDQLLNKHPDFYGFKALPPQGGFNQINYNGEIFSRPDTETVAPVQILEWEQTKTYGILQSPRGFTSFAINSKNLWFLPDYNTYGITSLVFCDVLHEVFGIPHEINPQFFVRIEDVHPERDPGKLREICKTLSQEKTPFLMAVIPQYTDPKSKKVTYLKDKPYLIQALHDCVDEGGSILMHGYTHQYKGESGEGHEFWDIEKDQPVTEYTESVIHEKMEKGIEVLTQAGLYPIGWETPHYAASERDYHIIAQHFSTAVEQRQVSDRSYRATQGYPFIVEDSFGQTVVPENLGYINFETGENIQKKIQNARPYLLVRDAIVGFFYHPYFDAKYLPPIIQGLKKMAYKPFDLRELPGVVVGKNTLIFSGVSTQPFPLLRPARRFVDSEEDPRLLKISLDNQWLHTFLLDYRYRSFAGYWSNERVDGEAMVQIPVKYQRLFVIEKVDQKPSLISRVKKIVEVLIMGKTSNFVETVQRWVIWALFIGTFVFLVFLGSILLSRTSYHESHFRKKH